ncbi:hypothetical protein D3C73_1354820 [compost metagenome]
MGRAHGFVQIEMHNVEAHVSRTGYAHNGVGIGAVIIKQAAGLVDNFGDFDDLLLEQAEGAGVRQHEAGGVRADCRTQCSQIHMTACIRGNCHRFESGRACAGRICSV